jgi:hypothetical protein
LRFIAFFFVAFFFIDFLAIFFFAIFFFIIDLTSFLVRNRVHDALRLRAALASRQSFSLLMTL